MRIKSGKLADLYNRVHRLDETAAYWRDRAERRLSRVYELEGKLTDCIKAQDAEIKELVDGYNHALHNVTEENKQLREALIQIRDSTHRDALSLRAMAHDCLVRNRAQ